MNHIVMEIFRWAGAAGLLYVAADFTLNMLRRLRIWMKKHGYGQYAPPTGAGWMLLWAVGATLSLSCQLIALYLAAWTVWVTIT